MARQACRAGGGGGGCGEDRAGESSPHVHSLLGDALGARIPRDGASWTSLAASGLRGWDYSTRVFYPSQSISYAWFTNGPLWSGSVSSVHYLQMTDAAAKNAFSLSKSLPPPPPFPKYCGFFSGDSPPPPLLSPALPPAPFALLVAVPPGVLSQQQQKAPGKVSWEPKQAYLGHTISLVPQVWGS